MSLPKSLEDRLHDGNVVPFVGAGVSVAVLDENTHQSVFPSWSQLLMGAAERLQLEAQPAEAELIRSLLGVAEPDFMYAATKARSALGAVWYEFLKEKLDIAHERIDEPSLELARCVWRLGSNLVITTNYDEVLRWACPRPSDLQSWDIQAPAEQALLLQQDLQRPVIWHLHGRISNAAQMILTLDGYKLLYPEANPTVRESEYKAGLETLRHQIASKSLVFVGFSLDDDYFGMQLKNLQEIFKGAVGPHFALVRERDKERVQKLNAGVVPITFSDFGDPLIALLGELATLADSSETIVSRKSNVPDYGPNHPVFFVPFRQKGDEIVGQEEALEDVRKQLTQGKPTAIGQTAAFRGLGGLGKTQLAVEYAYRYRDEYPNGVIWINADQDIDAQLIDIAEKARWIAPESDHKHKRQIAQQRVRSYSDCLIIFDNLDDRRTIDAYLPEPEASPHILVTSRIDHADFVPVPLGLLDEKLSSELLLKESRRSPDTEDEEKATQDIARSLGGLPLALELAGAYLSHLPAVTFRQYSELLITDLKTAMPKALSSFTQHEADLYLTLKLSEDLLQEERTLRDILDLLTWSGSAPMSSDLISTLLNMPNDGTFISALALGNELRLLQRSKEVESYSLHRLVGEVRRGEIPLELRLDWVDAICDRLGDWFQSKREDFSKLTQLEAEIDHLKTWQRNAAHFGPSHASRLMWLQAYPAYHRGRYIDARNYVIEAQRIFNQLGETNRALQANLLSDLASTNSMLGEINSILGDGLQALAIRRELFGERHPDIASSLSSVSSSYAVGGDLQHALENEQLALDMRRELFGERHPDIASSLNGVGCWYGEQGDLKKALEYSQQALAMRRELFGERHPNIATTLLNIGSWYGEQGDSQRALDYSEQALFMLRELVGERHPNIATALSNIGHWSGRQGNVTRALEYSQLALDMRRELFGERHPDIAASLSNLGAWYGKQGDLRRALEHSEQALEMQREIYGARHPDIAISLSNVALAYEQQDDLTLALDYFEQALVMTRELFGERHPFAIRRATRVITSFMKLNRRQEAYAMVGHLLTNLSPDDPGWGHLQHLERQLLAKTIRKGFRQPSKKGKGKRKKGRR